MSNWEMVVDDKKYSLKNYINNNLTDKNTRHSYLDIYDKLFLPFKNEQITILEIGVERGGSILLWHNWFQKAIIFCIDLIAKPQIFNNLDRVIYIQGDAYSETLVKIIPDHLDIAIDDGPHSIKSQKYFIDKYLTKIQNNGLLIIEDVPSDHRYEILAKQFDYKFILSKYIGSKIKKAKDDRLLIAKRRNV